MSSNSGVKMKSIEEEMSRFEEEIMSLTQDPTPIGGAAPNRDSNQQKGSSFQFQPRQMQRQGGGGGGGGGGVPRAPGFQPRQMGRPGGNMPPRPNRPVGGHQGFVPHQVRSNQRPLGPPRFPHLPPPPPPPPMNPGGPMGPMHGMGPRPPPPGMMGPLPPPPMPPFAMMPPGPPPVNVRKPVTLSARPTTYASKPVMNKKPKKKLKKEKSSESKDQSAAEDKEVKTVDEPPAFPIVPPGPPAMPHPTPMEHNMPTRSPMSLPPPPAIPRAFIPVPTPADLSQITQGGAGAYDLGTGSEPAKKKDKKNKKHIRVAAGTTWEDDTLAEWDPNDFRLFAGDLGNEVTEDTLTKVFGSYPSYIRCKIIRDKRTNKTKGYGFVSFKDPRDFVQAVKDWNGKYVGNRPIKLLKSTWKDRDVSSVKKKQKEKDRLGLR